MSDKKPKLKKELFGIKVPMIPDKLFLRIAMRAAELEQSAKHDIARARNEGRAEARAEIRGALGIEESHCDHFRIG